jgi:hypothetical protein
VVHVRYEDLRRETVGGLQRIVLELTGSHLRPEKASAIVEEFSFQRQAGRRPGEEDRRSFLRKGVVGDWRNQFSKGARETFDRTPVKSWSFSATSRTAPGQRTQRRST